MTPESIPIGENKIIPFGGEDLKAALREFRAVSDRKAFKNTQLEWINDFNPGLHKQILERYRLRIRGSESFSADAVMFGSIFAHFAVVRTVEEKGLDYEKIRQNCEANLALIDESFLNPTPSTRIDGSLHERASQILGEDVAATFEEINNTIDPKLTPYIRNSAFLMLTILILQPEKFDEMVL